jgi:hypothetical protein
MPQSAKSEEEILLTPWNGKGENLAQYKPLLIQKAKKTQLKCCIIVISKLWISSEHVTFVTTLVVLQVIYREFDWSIPGSFFSQQRKKEKQKTLARRNKWWDRCVTVPVSQRCSNGGHSRCC